MVYREDFEEDDTDEAECSRPLSSAPAAAAAAVLQNRPAAAAAAAAPRPLITAENGLAKTCDIGAAFKPDRPTSHHPPGGAGVGVGRGSSSALPQEVAAPAARVSGSGLGSECRAARLDSRDWGVQTPRPDPIGATAWTNFFWPALRSDILIGIGSMDMCRAGGLHTPHAHAE
jgi:hypothetical protein